MDSRLRFLHQYTCIMHKRTHLKKVSEEEEKLVWQHIVKLSNESSRGKWREKFYVVV